MPEFLLPDSSGRLVSLDDLIAEGPAVISFNRGHWCEYCTIELTALRQGLNEIAAHGAKVVSIMPESEAFTTKAAANAGNAFKVLSDIDNGYALTVGLAIWLGERVRTLYLSHGLNLERFQNSPNWFVPIPATFVVGRDGVIVARHVDPDFRNRMDIEEIVAALKRCGVGYSSGGVGGPVAGAHQPDQCTCAGRALAPGHAVKVDGALVVEAVDLE